MKKEKLQSKIKAKQEQMKKIKWVEEWNDHEIFNKNKNNVSVMSAKKDKRKWK